MSDADKENVDLITDNNQPESQVENLVDAQLPGSEADASKRIKKGGFAELIGSGAGRFYLVAICTVTLGFIGIGALTLMSDDEVIPEESLQVQAVRVPHDAKKATSISEQEAQNRKLRAQQEADAAYQQGDTYLPPIDDIAVSESTNNDLDGKQENAINSVFGETSAESELNSQIQQLSALSRGETQQNDTSNSASNRQHENSANEAAFNAGNQNQDFVAVSGTNWGAGDIQSNQYQTRQRNSDQYAAGKTPEQIKAEQAKIAKDLQAAKKARDEYLKTVNKQIMSQVSLVMGDKNAISTSSVGSTVTYYSASSENSFDGSNGVYGSSEGVGGNAGELLIKTGNLLFATLDSELNTDDGLDVFATIRGGEWNEAKVIGKVLIANNNVRIQFHTMAPQDDRPTMEINAIAMRPEDAKTGVADDIDHHTFERYASLGAASILSGLGKAAAMVESTTIESGNGTIGYNTKEPDTKQIIGMAVGEMGTAFASEIRKGFDQPTTYSTPAQKGLALYFMSDLRAPK